MLWIYSVLSTRPLGSHPEQSAKADQSDGFLVKFVTEPIPTNDNMGALCELAYMRRPAPNNRQMRLIASRAAVETKSGL